MKGYWIILSILLLSSCASLDEAELRFQNDADLIKLEHLVYWTGLIEEYESKTGAYPFQSMLDSPQSIGLVNIATEHQRSLLRGNVGESYVMRSVAELVLELEAVLGRTIEEMYDIQQYASGSPIGYNYFFTDSGYMFRTTCITCGATEISPLFADGVTPTISVASPEMKGRVQGAITRAELLSHPLYLGWSGREFVLEENARSIVAENVADSRNQD